LAIELMQQAMALQKEIGIRASPKTGHEFGVAMTSNNLGAVIATSRQEEDWAGKAKEKFKEASDIFAKISAQQKIAETPGGTDAARDKDKYKICNFKESGAEPRKGERFEKAVRLNMKWMETL